MQFPFKCKYQITQTYYENAGNRYTGPLDGNHHGALDIVPFNDVGIVFPAPVFPLSAGSEISIQDTDPIRGKGVRERILLDSGSIQRLKGRNLLPSVLPQGQQVCLDILYWHLLDVTDKDGQLEPGTSLGHAGNTGDVYHNGQAVPDNQKGVPPYYGLHLHLETILGTTQGVVFNLDKDPRGRIDPFEILNLDTMSNAKLIKVGDELGYWMPATTPDGLKSMALNFGYVLPEKADHTLDFSKITPDHVVS